jgi:hypothetical protein
MSFFKEIKNTIGENVYNKLEKLADRYFSQNIELKDLLEECYLFEEKGLKISPLDVTNILFKCKLFSAIQDEAEHRRRTDGRSYPEEYQFLIPWSEKSLDADTLIEKYFKRLGSLLKERILVTQISGFNSGEADVQTFFESLFQNLNLPFSCYFEGTHLIDKLKTFEPGLKEYNLKEANELFSSPSIGFKVFGSYMYCYFRAGAYLRTFLNLLKIVGVTYPPQVDFGCSNIQIMGPTSSVFLGDHTSGCFCWDEDKKEPWERAPDGCLFLSFGYRGISTMWLDQRAFGNIEKFFSENMVILESLYNPWSIKSLYDIAPTIDILSSAAQIPDIGAKVLLLYCALEHIFVPKKIHKDNKKYIIGGINALDSSLLSWFNTLYDLRCEYAHKGFVLRNDSTRNLIIESMKNVLRLIVLKLSK